MRNSSLRFVKGLDTKQPAKLQSQSRKSGSIRESNQALGVRMVHYV